MVRTAGRGKIREAVCEECRSPFTTRGRATRFCSNKCSTVFTGRRKRTAKGEVTCLRCGKAFLGQTVDWQNKPRRRYCSSYCYGLAMRKGDDHFVCEHCQELFPRKQLRSGAYWYAQRFCSKACANAAQATGGVDKSGYRVFSVGGRQIREHRLVMERVLGRALFPYETVHHRNGIRTDNRPENLEVWIGRHTPGQRLEDFIPFAADVLRDHGYHVTPPS